MVVQACVQLPLSSEQMDESADLRDCFAPAVAHSDKFWHGCFDRYSKACIQPCPLLAAVLFIVTSCCLFGQSFIVEGTLLAPSSRVCEAPQQPDMHVTLTDAEHPCFPRECKLCVCTAWCKLIMTEIHLLRQWSACSLQTVQGLLMSMAQCSTSTVMFHESIDVCPWCCNGWLCAAGSLLQKFRSLTAT